MRLQCRRAVAGAQIQCVARPLARVCARHGGLDDATPTLKHGDLRRANIFYDSQNERPRGFRHLLR